VSSEALEVSELARRLAFKLGCRLVLLGTVEPRFYVDLCGRVPVSGLDVPTRIGRARLVSPEDDWRILDSATGEWRLEGIELDSTVLLVGARELRMAEARAQLADALEQAPAAIVVGDDAVRGVSLLNELAASARAAGLVVEAATLVAGPDEARDCPLLVVSSGRDTRVGALVRGGLNSLAFDPDFDAFGAQVSRGRILVASYEVVGATLTGGIGTANTALALALAEAGHDVTLLYTGFESHRVQERLPRWADFYRARGLQFESLGELPLWHETSPHFNVARSFQLYRWLLKKDPFDVIHVPECQGHGYFAQLAKRQSEVFRQSSFVVGIHSSTRWCAEANRRTLGRLEHLVDDEIERRSVELADVLISPSSYLLDNTRRRGWKTPDRSFVQQYVVRETSAERLGSMSDRPTEIVYFGRIETRKGAELFCDAIDELARSADREFTVTFLGASGIVGTQAGEAYVAHRARHWPWPYSILTSCVRHEAIEYLRSRNCIAVMPSLVDNLPNTVIEAISLGIPFLASRSGGTAELIALDDLDRCTFDPLASAVPGVEPPTHSDDGKGTTHADLVANLRRALTDSHAVARFAVDPSESLRLHTAWNGSEALRARTSSVSSPRDAPEVRVTFALAGDASDLESTRITVSSARSAGVESQGVVVLMGEPDDADQVRLDSLQAECASIGWHLARQPSSHVARAQNRALEETAAPLIVFLRPGVALLPGGEERIRAALGTASALSFTALREAPTDGEDRCFVPLAGPVIAGLRYDAFSVGAYAVTRRAIERIGGFTSDAVGREADTDLLVRLQLAGCRVDQLVEPVVRIESRSLETDLVRRFAHVEGHPGQGDSAALLVERAFRRATPGPLVDAVALIGSAADPDWASGVQAQLTAAHQYSGALQRSRALRVARMIRRVQARVGSRRDD